jgi:uncharacterized protein (DUF2062 family)
MNINNDTIAAWIVISLAVILAVIIIHFHNPITLGFLWYAIITRGLTVCSNVVNKEKPDSAYQLSINHWCTVILIFTTLWIYFPHLFHLTSP